MILDVQNDKMKIKLDRVVIC